MAKYNVGDVLEITEDFLLGYTEFFKGEKYAVVEVDGSFYSLESVGDDYYVINNISELDAHSGFRKA